jgi:GH24 family phage-related lysozyme (muramidase)
VVSQQEFDAMVDMTFGLGSLSQKTAPKLLNALSKGDYETMADELRTDRATNGVVLPGLQKRSTQGQNIFLQGNYSPVSLPRRK